MHEKHGSSNNTIQHNSSFIQQKTKIDGVIVTEAFLAGWGNTEWTKIMNKNIKYESNIDPKQDIFRFISMILLVC